MKNKILLSVSGVVMCFWLSGCETMDTTLTARQVPENPSGIYKIEMDPKVRDVDVLSDSYKVNIVIDGRSYRMKKDEATGHFTYEYRIPTGQNAAKYYYDIKYRAQVHDNVYERYEQSPLYDMELINRYVITMESERGPVGAMIPVVGRGFTEYDKIIIGGVETETKYASPYSLTFVVPVMRAEQTYEVKLTSGGNMMAIGKFYVDSSNLQINTEEVEINSGERTLVVFQVEREAPGEGLPIEVTTDVPECVVMPEVMIPGGARTVSVMLEGGEPGEGALYVSAEGYHEVVLPLSVKEDLEL